MSISQQQPYGNAGAWALWSWRLRAACREVDSAVFFSPDAEGGLERDVREARAKAICARCPVIRECAVYALRHGERYGVWGGLSERDRVPFQFGA